ncbi:MAG: hypothetical protein ACI4M4_02410 [Candidatus Ornithospirochaeta sp.]
MKINGDNGKRLRKVSGIILALLFISLISSCSPVSDTLTLCRVSLDNPSSRSLTATVDPLGNNVYVKTIYKGNGEYYSNLSSEEYRKIPTEGIVVSQGLWEFQAIFSSDGKPSTYTDEEAKTLPGGTSGVIFINLSTQSISVKLDEGTGSAVISSYTLSGTVPENPSIYINLYKYNGTKFEIHDGTKFSGPQDSDTNVFSNTITNLPTGYYYATITVKSSSTVKAVDTIGFVVRKGLTTTITGSCSNYYSTSGGSIYLDPVEENKPTDSTTDTVVIKPPTNSDTGTVAPTISTGMTYVVQGDANGETSLGHSSAVSTSSRLNVPASTKFAMNLDGTKVYLSKIQNNGTNSQNESALVADLTSGAFMTIYNNNTLGNSATFAILAEGSKHKIVDRRLQSNILVNASQLNVVGKNATDPISNGDIVFIGPEDSHTNLISNEYRQGAINLEGTGGTINLDGNVKVNGLYGISSWHVKSTTTTKETSLSGNQTINITLRNGASMETVSTSASEVQTNNKNTDFASAHGIYIYGNSTNPPGGTINITLDGASIKTNSAGNVVSAGIRIENFNGQVTINITNSTITATNGYAMYFSNCPNVTINYKGTNIISGTKGNISGTVTTNNIQ